MPVVITMGCIRQIVRLAGAAAILQSGLWAQFPHAPVRIHDLTQEADAIVVGTMQASSRQGSIINTQLQVLQTLKGQLPLGIVVVDVIPSRTLADSGAMPANMAGRTGLWFLRESTGEWQVLARAKGDFVRWEDYSLPLPNATPISPSSVVPGFAGANASADQLVLAAMVERYESLPHPGALDDLDVVDLGMWKRADALAVVDVLRGSPKKDIQAIGLAAAIRLGVDDALTALAGEATFLQDSSKFFEIIYALNNFYMPNGEASIAPLQALIAARLNVPGLDLAAGTALQRIRTKNVLPAMALLLDSTDPQAELRAVSFFVRFTVFAQADGSIPDSGPIGPFWTRETQTYQPGRNSPLKTADLVSFWKSWWLSHKAQLGFE